MRLPAPQGDLRPVLRPGHARDAVLHRLPAARRPPLPGRRRRRGRPREGRGPARVRRQRHAGRARGRSRRCVELALEGSITWERRAYADRRPRRLPDRDRRDRRHRRQHQRVRGRRAPRDARQRRRRAAAVQLHPAGDRPHRPAGGRDLDRRRLAGAGQADEARDRRAVRRAVRAAGGAAQRRPRLGQGDAADLPGPQGVLRVDRQRRAGPDRAAAGRATSTRSAS